MLFFTGSPVAQWWSIRLLTGGLQVRVLPAEQKPKRDEIVRAFFMSCLLYILHSESADRFYTGTSPDLERRLKFHNGLGRGFTARYRPWKIVFTKEYPSRQHALAAEKKVKGWKSKLMIRRLIAGEPLL